MKAEVQGLARIPLLSLGFRPFFLGAAVWASLTMSLWLGVLFAGWPFANAYGAFAWHAHELLIGYTSAVITGFLLTAIPNWTGRLPVTGGRLLALFLLWVSGRVGLLAVNQIGLLAAMTADSLFLGVLLLIVLREIVSGRNWRNLTIAVPVAILAVANIGFHVETYLTGAPDYSLRAALAAILGLIMLVGGRIVPSFTRNWLVRQGATATPAPFSRFDIVLVLVAVAALALWVLLPLTELAGYALLVGGVAQTVRMFRWEGTKTWREPLVVILHIGYAFVPVGFLLVGGAVLWPGSVSSDAALHSWTTGAIGVMTLAVMTRASLGHTGQPLSASVATTAIYFAILVAAFARILIMVAPTLVLDLLLLAAAAWIAAFVGFILAYGPKLVRTA